MRHRRQGFNPWVGINPWRTAWQSIPVLLPGKSYGQRSTGLQRARHNWNDWTRSAMKFLSFHQPSWGYLLFSHSVVYDSLWPHGLQHARLPCPSSSPGTCSLSRWCHPTILSSVFPFSSCLLSFPSSGSFLMSCLFLHIRWPKDWHFSISPSNEYSGPISFRMDWLDLLTIQETLKSLLQHHSLKASALQHSAFFMVQFSHPNMTTGKTIAVTTRQTFVGKVISLLSNMLSRSVIVFLPRSKCLLNSWLQSLSAVILEPKKINFGAEDIILLINPDDER